MTQTIENYINLTRIKRPIGVWLLFFPCLFGIALTLKENPNINFIYFAALFFIGAFLMRSAGCIINDIFDRNFDKNVDRTKERPIAAGKISVNQALIFLTILLILSLLILLQFNQATILLGFISMIFVIIYPLAKRFTYFPQLFLGFTLNLGILFAFTASLGKITPEAVLLYAANIFWTLIYDTIYGYQDLEDDLKIGVKSTTMKFGQKPQKILYFLTACYLFFLIFLGILSNFKFVYFILILLASAHIACQIKTCNFSDGKICLQKFKSNIWVAIILLTAIILA
jgi:4-hydroxybenzoate polyprenyl transferase